MLGGGDPARNDLGEMHRIFFDKLWVRRDSSSVPRVAWLASKFRWRIAIDYSSVPRRRPPYLHFVASSTCIEIW